MAGTNYNSKEELIEAIQANVFKNNSFQTTSTKIQTAILDTVESMWSKSSSFVELSSYIELKALVDNLELIPGISYSFPYQCIHKMPGTSVLNINSGDYSELIETLVVKAVDVNKFDNRATSINYPSDIIMWDYNNNLAEDGITQRSGKIYFRHATDDNITTFYDFRGVYFRRYAVDTTVINNWVGSVEYSRNSRVLHNGVLYQALHSIPSTTTTFNSHEWINCTLIAPQNWFPTPSGFSYVNTYTYPDIDTFTDSLTFIGYAKNIYIAKTAANSGYNNIIFKSCVDINMMFEAYNVHMESCNNIVTNGDFYQNLMVGATDSFFKNTVNSFIGYSKSNIINTCTNSVVYNCNGGTITGDKTYNLLATHSDNFTMGSNSSCSVYNFDESSIGQDIYGAVLKNWSNSSLGDNSGSCKVSGVSYCDFGIDFSTISINEYKNDYAKIRNSTFGNSLYNITIDGNLDIYQLVCKNEVNNITIVDNRSLQNIILNENCNNLTFTNNCLMYDVEFESSCSEFLFNNTNMSKITFGKKCLNVEASNNIMRDSTFGHGCETITFNDSDVTTSDFGNSCLNFICGSYSISGCSFGSDCSDFTINGTLRNSTFDSYCKRLTITHPGTIEHSKLGAFDNFKVLNYGIYKCEIGAVNNITVNNYISRAKIASGVSNKTINGSFSKFIISEGNESTEIYNNTDANIDVRTNPRSLPKILTTAINYSDDTESVYYKSTAVDLNITGTAMPKFKTITFVLNNTDTASKTVTFGSTLEVVTQATTTLDAESTHVIQVMRVDHPTDKIIILNNAKA